MKALFFLHATQHCKGGEGKLLDFFMFQVRKTATAQVLSMIVASKFVDKA